MQELEITWGRVARVWWLLAWRGGVGAVIIGAVLGGIIGAVEGLMGFEGTTIAISGEVVGALAAVVWGLVVIRMALRKKYSDFRLALVPTL